jgi:predicted nuclease of predicted toxin-antitoxin system
VRFLLDHDVPAEVDHLLRHWGHDAQPLCQALPITAPDQQVFQFAQTQGRIILSCNRAHFLALARDALQISQPFPGLIVLIRRRSRQSECAHLLQLLGRAGETGLANNINFA